MPSIVLGDFDRDERSTTLSRARWPSSGGEPAVTDGVIVGAAHAASHSQLEHVQFRHGTGTHWPAEAGSSLLQHVDAHSRVPCAAIVKTSSSCSSSCADSNTHWLTVATPKTKSEPPTDATFRRNWLARMAADSTSR
jgi:hypothetical protein